MVKEPICANPDESVDQMRSIMTGPTYRYLPIMEKGT